MISLSACSHEQTEDIYILYTNDVASAMDNGVSYAGVKAYKDQLKAEHDYVTLVDAGDYFDGDVAEYDKGASLVSVMNAVGYDVVTLGNQELNVAPWDFGTHSGHGTESSNLLVFSVHPSHGVRLTK